jgi:hypothetical protein
MASYLETIAEFCSLSPFSEVQAAELEAKRPGHLMSMLVACSGRIDSRGIKRGDVPFQKPYPDVVKQWVADLVTPRAYRSLGVRPTDEQMEDIKEAAKDATADLELFSDPQKSLILLPLRQTDLKKDSQATQPATLATSEASPYTWRHKQGDRVRGDRRYG